MKQILLLLASSICFLQLSFAQVTGFAITNLALPPNFNPVSCDQTVSIGFSALSPAPNASYNFDLPYVIQGNNFSGFQFQTVVSWGDGTNSAAGGGTSTNGTNIVMNPALTHTYSSPGTYQIVTSVYNPANQTSSIDSIAFTVGSCSFQVYAFVGLDCDNNGTTEQNLQNVPFQLVGNNGLVYQDSSLSTMLYFTNISPGTYTLQIDPLWLASNGYQVQSSFPGGTITIPSPGVTTYAFTLICNQGQTQLCLGGTVFCDANGNGLQDSNESTVSNAPVQVNGFTAYTNNNGQYNLTYVGNINQYYGIQVSPNWIANSNYTVPANAPDSALGNPCVWGTTPMQLNIPLSCGNTSPTNCYGGFVFCDANNNGVFNTGELPLTFAPVQLFVSPNSTTSVTVYTDSSGYFEYCGPFIGTSNLILAQVSPTWLVYNGYSALTSYVTLMGTTTGQISIGNLPINCGGTSSCADLWTTVTPWIGYYQNSTAYIKLNWGSYGPGAVGTYSLSFTYPAGVSPILSSIQNSNYTISGNTITWNLSSASSNFTNYDVIMFNVPGGLINGAQHFYTSTIIPTGSISDCGTYNNNGSLLQILGNSYDPNDKNASTDYMNENYPLGYLDAFVDDALTYTIRFQNTGTAPAQNIYIIDTLSTMLDWSSFTLLEASHPMQVVNLGNGIMRFEFDQIWLADSTTNEPESHGHLTYRINELPTNAIMSVIENTAYIYFDWNAPIVTNTTFHQNMWLDNVTELEGALGIYPNPAQTEIQVELYEPSIILIKDLNGKTIFNQEVFPGQKIDIQEFKSGIYLIESKNQHGKFIKN